MGRNRHPDELIGLISMVSFSEIESLRERNVVVASLSSQSASGEKEEASAAAWARPLCAKKWKLDQE